jgi:hypothetical protein
MTTETSTIPEIPATTETAARTYVFRLELADEQQRHVGARALSAADFHRAIAETAFEGFRGGLLPEFAPPLDAARIEPIFAEGSTTAQVTGFRVAIPRPDGDDVVQEFGVGYFAAPASRQRARILQQHVWPRDKPLIYTLAAYLNDGQRLTAGKSSGMAVAAPTLHVTIGPLGRDDFPVREAWDSPQAGDLPVLVARSVIEQACAEASVNPEREIGGLLLGRLLRLEAGEVALAITCLVSGEGTTEATGHSVTFTAASFAKARGLAALRAAGEFVSGWHHSHPFKFCDSCPLPTPPECLDKVLFYSADDVQFMESTFYQPYHVGLLTAVEPRLAAALGHLPARLFGWRRGEIVSRGFEVVDD